MTVVEAAPVDAGPQEPPPDPGAQARHEAAALAALRAPVAGTIRIACVIGAVGALMALVPFIGLAELAETLTAPGPVDSGRVLALAFVVGGALGLRGLLIGLALGLTHFADVRLQSLLRRRMVEHLGRVPLGWFAENSSGRVRKAAQDDVHDLHQIVAHHAVEFTAAIVLPVGGLGYLVWLDWRLALLALAPFPLYAAAYAWMMRGYAEKMRQMNESQTRVSAAIVEFVSGIAVVKTFGRARRAHAAYQDAAGEFGRFYADWVRPMLRTEALATVAISAPVVGLIAGTGAVWFTEQGWVTPIEAMTGTLVAFVLPTTVTALGYGAQARRTAASAAARIDDLLNVPVLPVPSSPVTVPDGTPMDVEFDGVGFSYDGRVRVLDGVSLRCAAGTVTALVGPSGAGKTTLATLVPRFFDVTEGAVRIGGVDVRDIDPAQLYRYVGFVLQDVQLVRASVLDNVRLGRPEASEDEVERACRAAQIHDRITALPRGYASVVGEDAILSGGEAQRVSIARALLADTPILVLDEATAFADPESEAAIQDALSILAAGRTVLVIAHRLSTIAGASQIAVLKEGHLTESGTHEQLLAQGGLYARMWAAHEGVA